MLEGELEGPYVYTISRGSCGDSGMDTTLHFPLSTRKVGSKGCAFGFTLFGCGLGSRIQGFSVFLLHTLKNRAPCVPG